MNKYRSDQEAFWAGEFGDGYSERNVGDNWIASNITFFSRILSHVESIDSVLEFGANIGLNLLALRTILPNSKLSAIEINASAIKKLRSLEGIEVFEQSILDFQPDRIWDLVLIKGVLIHIAPESLEMVYQSLYQSANRYILIAEYYNPTPVELSYRGHEGKLFKRDFAGEMLDTFSDLSLRDYGFVYHRDTFPQDDINWFLLEKINKE